ncbi:MAG: stage II sporulation protein M [Actinobacteria bacterium]|nr:stage II sporulation protein M [Actinomycetota bacterium]
MLLAATVTTATAVHFLAAAEARQMLGFGFAGVRHTPATALGIFANNARVLAAILAAAIVVQAGRELAASAPSRAFPQALTSVCDCALLLFCSLNVLAVGAAYGAYGLRTVRATVVHGPFELAAFSLALALYLASRRERLDRRRCATAAGVACALLMIGAILEAYV